MTQLTFKSPGVSTREIDLSGPTAIQPTGVPAGVIGTAVRGPAFVPITVATFQDFISKFGNSDGEKFGPLAMREWLNNANAGTYVRLLGVGDAKKRTSSGDNSGKVTNAGFVVGSEQVQGNGNVGANPYATSGGSLGRTYFLGAFHSESNGSNFLQDAGIQTDDAHPLIRGVIMTPSGVLATLGSIVAGTKNIPNATTPGGSTFGDVETASSKQEFSLMLNGHVESDTSTNVITASFDPQAPNYFAKVFNTDATRIEEMGHYLYSSYDIYQTQCVITASGVTGHDDKLVAGYTGSVEAAFLLSGSANRNSGSSTTSTQVGVPSFENFEDRFRTAYSPFVISQKFGGVNKNIFKIHALDDGRAGSDAFKITIENIQASTNENNPYGTFDLAVRYFADSDSEPVVLERFAGLDLNPSSDNFVARRIGDTHTYYDFDKSAGSQKLVIDGSYPNVSNYIRIELSSDLRDNALNDTALPVGFRGLNHLVTSGSASGGSNSILSGTDWNTRGGSYTAGPQTVDVRRIVQPPVPFRETVAKGSSPKKVADAKLTWGVQFEQKDSLTEPNKHQKLNESIRSFVRYMPDFHTDWQSPVVGGNEGTPDVGGSILDADRFNNNIFTLERVQVITGSGDRPDDKQWAVAAYRRNGVLGSMTDIDGTASTKTRFLNPSTDFAHLPTRRYLKFTFPLQGGFDGVNIFDEDKAKFSDAALRREMDNAASQGGVSGPTVAGYRKAIRVMEEKSDVDIQLLAIPGVRHESVTDFAIESVERRFDALYIMDIEERDTLNNAVTGSDSIINVRNTVDRHASRNFDTSFAAAYFPDVVIQDRATLTNVQCPPSVAVLGAFAFNDSVAHPWYAPAGFNRGSLSTVIEEQVKLNRSNLDNLYDSDINPITSFPSTPGVVIWGQKTMLAGQSALDRVNVRRLLIDVRRQVKNIANSLLFEPNRESTLAKFSNAVTPILGRIQQQQGLDRFRVQIDTTTTTQADVENNTIRGKIYLQPTRSVEFISLDFVVTNAGAEI